MAPREAAAGPRPSSEGEGEGERRALWMVALAFAGLIAAGHLVRRSIGAIPEHTGPLVAYGLVVLLVSAIAIRRGVAERAMVVVLTADLLLMLVGVAYLAGGISAPVFMLAPAAVLVPTFMMGRRAGVACATVLALSGVLLWALEIRGWAPPLLAAGEVAPHARLLFAVVGIGMCLAISLVYEGLRTSARVGLEAQERRYRTLVEGLPTAVYRSTVGGRVVDCNPAFLSLFDFPSLERALATPTSELYASPADRGGLLGELVSRGEVRREVQLRAASGRLFWGALYARLASDRDAEPMIEGVISDVTQARDASLALDRSERMYRDLVENNLGIICTHDPEGRILSMNAAGAASLGSSARELVGRNLRELVEPAATGEVDQYLQALGRDRAAAGTLALRARGSQPRYLQYRSRRLEEQEEGPTALFSAQDVTDLQVATRRLAQSDVAMRSLYRVIAERGAHLIDTVGKVLEVGTDYLEMEVGMVLVNAGETFEPLVSRHPRDLAVPDRVAVGSGLARALRTGNIGLPDLRASRWSWTLSGTPLASLASRPLQVDGRSLGVLCFAAARPRERPFNESERELLDLMGSWIGTELDRHEREGESQTIVELQEVLQSCSSVVESLEAISPFLRRLFPSLGGALYLRHDADQRLGLVASWGRSRDQEEVTVPESFEAQDCWALRRSAAYASWEGGPGPRCRHVTAGEGAVLCTPLAGDGKSLGLLVLESAEGGRFPKVLERLAARTATSISLSLSNLRLRVKLEDQAMIDQLTGLGNRRMADAVLERELRLCQRAGVALSVLMIDVDEFKLYNDTHGHPEGDRCLQKIAETLRRKLRRSGDFLGRVGGEELICVLPGVSLEQAVDFAETLRESIEELGIPHPGSAAGVVTISAGVHCAIAGRWGRQALVEAADRALYAAKRAGRNRVEGGRPFVLPPASNEEEQAAGAGAGE
ncbi:MAG TPA: diguanylate cyclase [Thermoanaerobaculia bacterium]|nr:diguanylate cyclase [Thermoanaerobaculia bacterium]